MPGHQCYHCKQWVEEGEAHDCWTTTEAALTRDLSEDLQEAYERLRDSALELGDQRVYASHHSIMFSRKSCYFFVRPKKSFLEVCLFLGRPVQGPADQARREAVARQGRQHRARQAPRRGRGAAHRLAPRSLRAARSARCGGRRGAGATEESGGGREEVWRSEDGQSQGGRAQEVWSCEKDTLGRRRKERRSWPASLTACSRSTARPSISRRRDGAQLCCSCPAATATRAAWSRKARRVPFKALVDVRGAADMMALRVADAAKDVNAIALQYRACGGPPHDPIRQSTHEFANDFVGWNIDRTPQLRTGQRGNLGEWASASAPTALRRDSLRKMENSQIGTSAREASRPSRLTRSVSEGWP